MVQLKSENNGFELKDSSGRLELDGEILRLGELTISEPGEFESNSIEIIYGEKAALIVWERLQLAYIFRSGKPTSFEKSQFAPCDIVIISPSAVELEKADFNEILETYDPRLVITKKNGSTLIQGIANVQETKMLKLATQSLPQEGREFVALE